jgi:hypothetical protein
MQVSEQQFLRKPVFHRNEMLSDASPHRDTAVGNSDGGGHREVTE